VNSPELAKLGKLRLGSRGGEVHFQSEGQAAVHDASAPEHFHHHPDHQWVHQPQRVGEAVARVSKKASQMSDWHELQNLSVRKQLTVSPK
jgi:hypothetical protein